MLFMRFYSFMQRDVGSAYRSTNTDGWEHSGCNELIDCCASYPKCFCCLGYALTSFIRNEDAALPTTQALLLPLYFISGVFVAGPALPHWLADVGEIFPVRHLANALLTAYNPHTTGLGFAGPDLLIVAAWGVAGLLIALRRFSWLPLGR